MTIDGVFFIDPIKPDKGIGDIGHVSLTHFVLSMLTAV